MAPLSDRSANRQSRIPVVGSDSVSRLRTNNENAPPGSNLSRLLAPTKSSVARAKSPPPIPLPIAPRVNMETPFRGRLSAVTSNESLNAAFSHRQSIRRPSPSPIMSVLNSRRPESPIVQIRNSTRQSRPNTPSNDLLESKVSSIKPAPQNKPLPAEKALPSRPPFQSVDSMSPTRFSRSIIDATERPLIKSPGTPHEEEWPALSPERPVSRRSSNAPSRSSSMRRKSSSRLPRSSVHNSPAMVSPILSQLSTDFASPCIGSSITSPTDFSYANSEQTGLTMGCLSPTEEHPPRSSSLLRAADAESVDLGLGISTGDDCSVESTERQERKYLPAVNSFSRPRAQPTTKSTPAPETPVCSETKSAATASRLPLTSPKKTPDIVEIRSSRSNSVVSTPKSPVAEEMLTFAGRRLGNSTDLAALDQGGARSTRRRANTVKTSPPKKVNLTLHDLPPRVPSPAEPTKLSPIRFIFGDKGNAAEDPVEYSRVKKLSGSLLSSSFAGSTLSISGDADNLIFGPPSARSTSTAPQSLLQTPVDAEFDLPSPDNNGFHVSWPDNFGFSVDDLGQNSPTVQSSPSVRKESIAFPPAIGRISEEAESFEKEATLDVELSLSVTAPGGSDAPAQKTIRAPIGDLLAAAINDPQDDKLPGATITAQDELSDQHITATLSILEGTPVKESTEEDYADFANDMTKKAREAKKQLQEAQKESQAEQNASSAATAKPVKKRPSMAKLPKTASKDKDEGSAQLPSYMLPTPASEARKNLTATNTDARRNNTTRGPSPNPDGRRASQAVRLTPTPSGDRGRISPSGRQTPVSELRRGPQSGRSTPNTDIPRTSQNGRATPSSDMRSATPTTRANISRKSSHGVPTKASGTKEISDSTLDSNRRASVGSVKAPRHVPLAEMSREGSATPSTRPRSESKGKSVLNNLKGLFSSGKRDTPPMPGTSSSRRFSIGSRKSVSLEPDVPDVPALPPLPDSKRKSMTKSILVKKGPSEEITSPTGESFKEPASMMPRPKKKSTTKHVSSKKDAGQADDEKPTLRRKASKGRVASATPTPDVDAEQEKRDTVALMEMGLTLRQEAFKEDDIVRKERMTSFAQVMLDTVTNAVEAERNMYAAMQAAEQAKMSYMMTQQSVQEMNKLVSTSRRLPLFKRKKQTNTGA